MRKKHIFLLIVLFAIISASVYVLWRLNNRWTDINGVTTLIPRNTVYMNAKPGVDFDAGSGEIIVDEGKHIHVEYDIDSGNFDLAFFMSVNGNVGLDLNGSFWGNLPASGDVFGKSGVSGKGSLDFDVAPGAYEVWFNSNSNDLIGSAKVTARLN